ncbi:L-rhamnose isomerase [Ammoniphilus sp. 3BR4]
MDRRASRQRLKESLDQIFQEKLNMKHKFE